MCRRRRSRSEGRGGEGGWEVGEEGAAGEGNERRWSERLSVRAEEEEERHGWTEETCSPPSATSNRSLLDPLH